MEPYGGLIETPNIERDRRARAHVHELPHHGALLADAVVPADGAQPHDERHGVHHRGDVGLPERERAYPVRVREPRRGPRGARLEHVPRGQVASVRRRRDEPGLVEAPVAARARVRALLRLPGRRDEPVVSGPRLRQPPVEPPALAGGRLPPDGRPDRQGDRVHPGREGDRAGEAVLHVLLPGRGHAPHHAPKEWVDKYKGRFDMGYEAYRELVFERQKELGIVPEGTELSPMDPYATTTSHDGKPWSELDRVRPWDSLTEDEKRLFARMAEVYAGFLSHADHEFGRLLDYLEQTGRARQHDHRAGLRQRRVGRGRAERLGQREQVLQRRPGHDGGEPGVPRRARQHADLQPLPDGLGVGVQHAVQDVEALRELRGRHGGSADRLLAARASRRAARSAGSTATRSTSCRRCSRRSTSRCRRWSTATRRSRWRA